LYFPSLPKLPFSASSILINYSSLSPRVSLLSLDMPSSVHLQFYTQSSKNTISLSVSQLTTKKLAINIHNLSAFIYTQNSKTSNLSFNFTSLLD
jgi:hypothetical protein